MKYIQYSTKDFKFKEITATLFNIEKPLQSMHKDDNFKDFKLVTREKDQDTIYHKIYYDNFQTSFKETYVRFIRDVIKPENDFEFYYQTIPTFRIQPPNNLAVGEFHKDKSYNHDEREINFYLPFTFALGNNTIWVESQEDKGDYEPINVAYSDVVQWDGSNLKHGNKINDTGFTRISIDFRIVPKMEHLKTSNKKTINTNMQFKLGSYWSEL